MPILYLMPCASFLNRDFAFGDQGASPLEPDRQGAGAGYEIWENRSGFPSGWGSPDGDRHGCTGAAHRFGWHKARFFAGF